MSVRPPQSFRQSQQNANGFNVLEYELMSERADALGRHGLKVESALAALKAWAADRQSAEERETLLNAASDAVWAFFIQREICGLRNNRDAVQRYGIPNEVIARLGAVRK
ncbi:hypothetical protein CO657_35285 (plasmid) [Rhizobium acidisoli]|uniref:Uncharacterized protein n=1 Tax=Rhizobium acidisoli TaxID=1538158 RepID=A0AAE6C5Q7_9HYPH|nr:DUF6665 family protein [Rhizobium acidisoli]KPH05907.1 hypothetical protein AOG23_25760 [Rhizobium acidisoli]QAS83054.1 hypothetical protein CO657_35285 [Rhizobium acidisoli]